MHRLATHRLAWMMVFCLAAVAAAATAHAQEPERIGAFGSWTAYNYESQEGAICAISSEPERSAPEMIGRKGVYFIVTLRPGSPSRYEIAVRLGYQLAKGVKQGEITIGDKKYALYGAGEASGETSRWVWPINPEDEPKILQSMRRGLTLTVSATPREGQKTQDRYSLKGVTAALISLEKTCPDPQEG